MFSFLSLILEKIFRKLVMGNWWSSAVQPPPPMVLVPPLFDFPPLAARTRMLESSYHLLFGKLALRSLFDDYFEEAKHFSTRIMLKPIDDPHVDLIATVAGPLDHKPDEKIVGNAQFRWQSGVDDPHTFVDLFVSNTEPILLMRFSAYYPKFGLGGFAIVPVLLKQRVSSEDYGVMGLRYGSSNLSVGATIIPFSSRDELPKNAWLVSKMGRLTAGVQYEPQFGGKDVARYKNLANWSCAVGYGLGSGSPLSPSFNFGLELAKNSQVKNPFEENEIVGITNYIDFGFELQTRVNNNKSTNNIHDSTFQVAASWQANKNFLLKGKMGPLNSSIALAFKSWWKPSFTFSISGVRDRIRGETAFGFGIRVDNIREASYQRADPNFVMLTPNKEHLAEGIHWKSGSRTVLQSDLQQMAALTSTLSSSNPKLSRSPTSNSIPKFSLTKSLSQFNRPNSIAPIVVSALRNRFIRIAIDSELDSDNGLKKLVDSLFVLCASVALSASLFVTDVDSASAFAVATPRKLQTDELATVRLFQDNTPSVVYITNLAARCDFPSLLQPSSALSATSSQAAAAALSIITDDASPLDSANNLGQSATRLSNSMCSFSGSGFVWFVSFYGMPQGSGSGFVWDTQGHIVTNYHVIRAASDLKVTLADQSTYDAKIVGFDQDKDVAVLLIDGPKDKLRPIPIGVSADLLVGQKVYAIGNPFGLDHTLTTGVISGLRREISSAATGRLIQDVIQTDAAINPGNSGGPLLDSSGNLIGINTAIYSPSGASSGVGFSIPVDTVSGIVDQLVKFGKVTRPILGIKFAPDQSVEQLGVSGVLVLDAPSDGPAGKAGLRPTKRDNFGRLVLGDVITSINGKKISNGSDLYRILDQCEVGDEIIVEVLRGDHLEKIPVILEPKPDES
ncbi:hypothetical protein BUALT_Bualt16G0012700 [Buddleja alternifolia]|uniref:PDZ domain-containing protein n=1 Tax=Buddleja alternifolia TaxID=168488 RepID=A0AAV6W850_9LAMI|nr:hypothetical protein BUALT_Bualt16G0012700 [Buddleja alternifolia]